MWTISVFDNINRPLVSYSIYTNSLYEAIFEAFARFMANDYTCEIGECTYTYRRVI